MKVKLRFPIPGQKKDAVIEADGTPAEVATFLKKWLAEVGPITPEDLTKKDPRWPSV